MAQRHYQRGREPTDVSLYVYVSYVASMFTCYGNFTIVDIIATTTTYCHYDHMYVIMLIYVNICIL